ncbi:MAG: class I SAM-dependent methyltransferase [Ferrovum sp.]|nr:class I SAM-dependent methyltransferase [Ferrovum sp.]
MLPFNADKEFGVTNLPTISWRENDEVRSAQWRSESHLPPPKRVVIADDRMTADVAYRLACEGTAMLWRGDFQNARQRLAALKRRIDEPRKRKPPIPLNEEVLPLVAPSLPLSADAFHRYRLLQSQRARTLGMLLLQFDADFHIPLRRAPDVQLACSEAYGTTAMPFVASLRELLGIIGAHEWRTRGIEVPSLGARIHPHYGVFAPIRSEYVDLLAAAPLPPSLLGLQSRSVAFDIGTGTGVLSALLAKRGVAHVVAAERDPRAIACARDNIAMLKLDAQVEVRQTDLYPDGRATLIVCNPPWIPARPVSPLEHAVYDPESRMLRGFLHGLVAHLEPDGEGWLLISNLAEHLGLRTPSELATLIDAAGLMVIDRIDIRPHHPRVADIRDPLYTARQAEVTSLWRLRAKD